MSQGDRHVEIPSESCEKCLSDADARKIARAVVHETLITLGADTEHPLELQADFRFVRSMRQTHEKVGMKIILTGAGMILTGTITLIVLGFAKWVGKA